MFYQAPTPTAAGISCPNQSQNSVVIDPLQPGLQHRGVPRFENARLSVAAPSTVVRLSEPVDIHLLLKGPGVKCVQTVQCHLDTREGECMSRLPATVQIVPVLSRPDGSHYISFIPLIAGRVGLVVTAEFSSGVFSEQSTSFTVEYPTRIPDKLNVALSGMSGQISSIVPLSLEEAERGTTRRLIPNVLYANSPKPFPLEPARVKFTVKTAGGMQVVRVDPSTGTITPVALGNALVITQFAGAVTTTCVVVVPTNLDTPKKTNCADLEQPIYTLPQ